MAEVGVYGASQLCLEVLVVELEEFTLVVVLACLGRVCAVLCSVCIDHFYLVIEQSHGLDLFF